jgi:DNA polymerase III alpha subunit
MAYCTIEDAEGSIEVIVFPQLYRTNLPILQKDILLLIKGTVDKTEKGIKILRIKSPDAIRNSTQRKSRNRSESYESGGSRKRSKEARPTSCQGEKGRRERNKQEIANSGSRTAD